jgi:solute carrier family 44 (choline transporter-like protein), member 2/4/5
MVLIGLAAAMLVSLVWILMMRFIAGFMVWLSILAVLALQAVGELPRS